MKNLFLNKGYFIVILLLYTSILANAAQVSVYDNRGREIDFSSDNDLQKNERFAHYSKLHIILNENEIKKSDSERKIRIKVEKFSTNSEVYYQILIPGENPLNEGIIYTDENGNGKMDYIFPPNVHTGRYEVDVWESKDEVFKKAFLVYNVLTEQFEAEENYYSTIYYADEFSDFNNSEIFNFARECQNAIQVINKQYNNWHFTSPEDIDYYYDKKKNEFVKDDTLDIYIDDQKKVQTVNITNNLWFGYIHIGYENFINSTQDQYSSTYNALLSTLAHEYLHAVQYHYPKIFKWINEENNVQEGNYIIEGQARFMQSVFMRNNSDNNEEFLENRMYPKSVNDYLGNSLKQQNSIKTLSYNFCLFWRFLFENYCNGKDLNNDGIVNTADSLKVLINVLKASNDTTEIGNDPIIDGEKTFDIGLSNGGGCYKSFDEAITKFAEKLLYVNEVENPPHHWGEWYDPNLIYEKPYYVAEKELSAISERPLGISGTIDSSFSIDLLNFNLDKDKSILFGFAGNFSDKKVEWAVNIVLFDEGNSPAKIHYLMKLNENKQGYFAIQDNFGANHPISRVEVSIVRLDALEEQNLTAKYMFNWRKSFIGEGSDHRNYFVSCFNEFSYLSGLQTENSVIKNWKNIEGLEKQKYNNGAIIFNPKKDNCYWLGEGIFNKWIEADIFYNIGLPITSEYSDSANYNYATVDFENGQIYWNGTEAIAIIRKISADFNASPLSGDLPLTVQFTDLSTAENTSLTSWQWDFNNDGIIDSHEQNPIYVYKMQGEYNVRLAVSDGENSNSITKEKFISVTTQFPMPNITKIEYFFDHDPGFGNGIKIPITNSDFVNVHTNISVINLSEGLHRLYIRALDENGRWGIVQAKPVLIQRSTQSDPLKKITKIEYFYDQDPGFGRAGSISFNSDTTVFIQTRLLSDSLELGLHRVYVRAKDNDGTWGIPQAENFQVDIIPAMDLSSDVLTDSLNPNTTDSLNLAISNVGDLNLSYKITSGSGNTKNNKNYVQLKNLAQISQNFLEQSNGYFKFQPLKQLYKESNSSTSSDTGYGSWYSYYPTQGIISSGDSSNITIKINTSGIDFGIYTDSLIIKTNDPNHALSYIPLFLEVKSITAINSALKSFSISVGSEGVILEWSLKDTGPIKGFNIYRSTSDSTGFVKINNKLIEIISPYETTISLYYSDHSIVQSGLTYYYKLEQINIGGGKVLYGPKSIFVEKGTLGIPLKYNLSQCYPNPFNPSTTIKFAIPRKSHVIIEVFNLLGQNVATLLDEEKLPGYYKAIWDGKDNHGLPLSSGLYFYRIKTKNYSNTKKMILIR